MDYFECGLRQLKFAGADDAMAFEGYGAVFGNTDSYGDVIVKGAFARTLHEAKASGQWPAMLEQHGGMGFSAADMTPIGVWTDLSEDDVGLKVAGTLAPTARGQEMYALMKMKPRPAINGLSIGYVPIDWKIRATPDEPRRTLKEIKLLEISPVTFPANGKARVNHVKSANDIRSFESFLRDVGGFSRNEAKRLASGGWPMLDRCDDDSDTLADLMATVKAARLFS